MSEDFQTFEQFTNWLFEHGGSVVVTPLSNGTTRVVIETLRPLQARIERVVSNAQLATSAFPLPAEELRSMWMEIDRKAGH